MTLQTLPLSALKAPKANPRQNFDTDAIEGLAASIEADGVLQNLIVTPSGKGKRKRYAIVSGERRFRALTLLQERGAIEADFAVPVEIRDRLDETDGLRLATVENVQREALAPLDEAAAFVRLLQDGAKLADVAARTGLSESTIKRRIALEVLCEEARAALSDDVITLAQAEALTLGTQEEQKRILENMAHGFDYDAGDIREILTEAKPTVAMAIFPVERYAGTFTADLFAEAETSYFDDGAQFFALQREAVEALAEEHREGGAAWVEIAGHYRVPSWQYDEAEDGEEAGVLINLAPTGRVDVLTGLVQRATIDPETRAQTAEPEVKKPRPAYTVPLCRYFAWHKSVAVQQALLANPRKAKEIGVLLMLECARAHNGAAAPHEALRSFAAAEEVPASYREVNAEAQSVLHLLRDEPLGHDPAWCELVFTHRDPADLYETLKALSDEELDRIAGMLAALAFGQDDCNRLDTDESLFNRVACDLEIDMRAHWRPDRSFLERRNKQQLIAIAEECGYAEGVSLIGGFKKSELVSGLLRFFEAAHAAETPSAAQAKALQWLPEAMAFPAVDPDARAQASDDESLDEAA